MFYNQAKINMFKLIARPWSLTATSLPCKNIYAAHYSKSIKGINTKLGILAHYDKMPLQDKGA